MVNLTICLPGLIETHQQMVISALNIPFSVTAFLGNLLIIVALQKPSSLQPPSKLLLGCLASTDLCVGLIMQPIFVAYLMSSEHYKRCYNLQLLTTTIIPIFCGVSLMTMTAISVDRLLALMLRLRYRQVVTLRRIWLLVTFLWLYRASISAIFFFNDDIFFVVICTEVMLCIITSTYCYSKIYLILRQHQAQVQDHVHQGQLNGGEIPLNIARYKNTVSGTLWVQAIFLLSYLPLGLAAPVNIFTGQFTPSRQLAAFIAISIVSLNSSLNPFLYCWKMRAVRQAVKSTIKAFWC